VTLEALIGANPRHRERPGQIQLGDVLVTRAGIRRGLAEALPPALSPPAAGWILGSLSSTYVTGGRGPGTVSSGVGDAGGLFYGS
jgi:hypothetical protein